MNASMMTGVVPRTIRAVSTWALAVSFSIHPLALQAANAKSDVAWTCAFKFPTAANPNYAAVLQLIRDGDMLKIRGAEFIEYKVLEDNEVGLVAVKSYSEVGDRNKHLGADVLVIDKATMDFRKGNVFVPGAHADNTVRSGTCKK